VAFGLADEGVKKVAGKESGNIVRCMNGLGWRWWRVSGRIQYRALRDWVPL